jgi:ABC-2 type transport system permease protein
MSAARITWTIARRELTSYFTSPVAYVFLVIFLLLAGFLTFTAGSFFERGEASLASFFIWHPWLYLILVPAVGMRLWSEERRAGTLELLLTMPVATWQAIVAKFLASWIFLALALALTFPVVITVNLLGAPDNGQIASGYLGSLLLAGACLAIACMTSAMTRNQVVSFIVSVVILLFLILAGFNPVLGEPGARRHGGRVLGDDALRRLPEGRDRQPRPDFLPLGDRLRAVRHGRDHPQPPRGIGP